MSRDSTRPALPPIRALAPPSRPTLALAPPPVLPLALVLRPLRRPLHRRRPRTSTKKCLIPLPAPPPRPALPLAPPRGPLRPRRPLRPLQVPPLAHCPKPVGFRPPP